MFEDCAGLCIAVCGGGGGVVRMKRNAAANESA